MSNTLFFINERIKVAITLAILARSLWFSGIAIAYFMFLRVYVSRYSGGMRAAFVKRETTSMEFKLIGLSRILSR